MSGYPHGLDSTPPHGDALLRPGKDYELRGNEIVEATGGVMRDDKLRAAAERAIADYTGDIEGEVTCCACGHPFVASDEYTACDCGLSLIRAALAATADAPPEASEEMWELIYEVRSFLGLYADQMPLCWTDKLRALAAADGPWKIRQHDEREGWWEVYNHCDWDIPRLVLETKLQAADVCGALNKVDRLKGDET